MVPLAVVEINLQTPSTGERVACTALGMGTERMEEIWS